MAQVTRRQRHAHRYGNDGGVLGARRHLDAHKPSAVGERASLEDVVGERRPGIFRFGSCCERKPSRGKLQSYCKARDTKPSPLGTCRTKAAQRVSEHSWLLGTVRQHNTSFRVTILFPFELRVSRGGVAGVAFVE